MKLLQRPLGIGLLLLSLCGAAPLAGAPDNEDTSLSSENAEAQLTPDDEQRPYSRLVRYRDRDVVRVNSKVRYTTLIILPEREQILDYTCGDKEYWAVDGSHNFAYVKPAKVGSETNINLVTARGNVYSFVLTEVSESAGAEPDLKVFVKPIDDSTLSSFDGTPRFVLAAEVEGYRSQAAAANADAEAARAEAERRIAQETDRFRAEYPTALRFDYRYRPHERPFFVDAIYHDGQFTYIRAAPEETPALYEIKDGKPNLVNFEYRDGAFVVSKVLDSGYLAIGKSKFRFLREE